MCRGGAIGGFKLGDKVAELEAKRLKLPPEAAAQQKRAFEIGFALALCGGGKAIVGTTYSKLSERDKKARQKHMEVALDNAQPIAKTYALPDHPDTSGSFTVQPSITEGSNECRTIEDHLADASASDSALVKYCRKPPDGKWAVAL